MHIRATRSLFWRHPLKTLAIIFSLVAFGTLLPLAVNWPFTHAATVTSLEQVTLSKVRIRQFAKTFFPHPGYIANEVTFSRGQPIARIRRITCRANWLALLTYTHRIHRMELEGARVVIPAPMPPPVRSRSGTNVKTTVSELIANGAVLEIASRNQAGRALRFDFPELSLTDLARNKPIHFRTIARNPNPPADLTVSGTVGPLALGRIAATPLSGSFQLRHADLSMYQVVKGILSGTGGFKGTLGHAEVTGEAEIPDFQVTASRHALGLRTRYRAVVDGTRGDVSLSSVQARFLGTTLLARGSVSGHPYKTVALDLSATSARVEDLLRLFVTADHPPLNGLITLRADVLLPPERRSFLKRVRLVGDFSIANAEFTNPSTQQKVNKLSARAAGDKHHGRGNKDSVRVTSALQGRVRLRDAVAGISAAYFAVPGAISRGSGTYDLISQTINIKGELAMHNRLSKAAGGIKSVLLLPLDPFFKKNGAGAVLPVSVKGTYSHPVFKVSLTGK